MSAAKALAAARRLPLTPVDHLHGHVVAPTLQPDPIEPPYLVLVASGGHTFLARVDEPSSYTVLGQTLDDAAGEAFDKGARLLGLGYPGGPELDRLARRATPRRSPSPAGARGRLDFRSAGSRRRCSTGCATSRTPDRADLAASYQRAIVEALVARAGAGARARGVERLALGGGRGRELRAARCGPGDGR